MWWDDMMDDGGAAGGGGGVYYLKWEIGEGCASLEVSLVLVFRSTNERHFLVCFFAGLTVEEAVFLERGAAC